MPRAALIKCRACRAPVWAGLDGDAFALYVQTDTAPLAALGEALALMQSRPTYELRRRGAGCALYRRDRWSIRGRPPGQAARFAPYDVLAAHRCGSAALPTVPTALLPSSARAVSSGACPY